MDDPVIVLLVVSRCTSRDIIAMKYVSKVSLNVIESGEFLTALCEHHQKVRAATLNDVLGKLDKLLLHGHQRSPLNSIAHLLLITRGDFDDEWKEDKCQYFEFGYIHSRIWYRFSCNNDGPICESCNIRVGSHIVRRALKKGGSHSVRETCKTMRQEKANKGLITYISVIEETSLYARVMGV